MTLEVLEERPPSTVRRPAWRQRLVDVETGFRVGFRADSTLLISLFFGGAVLLTALVVGLGPLEWAILVLALGMALSAEMFHQVLKQVARRLADREPGFDLILRLGTTAVVSAQLTTALVALVLFGSHFAHLLQH